MIQTEKIAESAKTVTGGFCMALADSVPGVSGSTVAFVMGFYDNFISSLHGLSDCDSIVRRRCFIYLAKLFSGWIAGMTGAVLFLSRNFQTNSYFFCSIFLGMTVASIPFIVRQEKTALKRNYGNSWLIMVGIAVAIGMFFLRPPAAGSSSTGGALDFHELTVRGYVFLFISGIFGIVAMLLPGISGSTLLLMLGVYLPAITSLSALLHGDAGVLPGIIALSCGVLAGIVLSVRCIHRLMTHNRNAMLYFIIGLVAGSVFAIIRGSSTIDASQPAMTLKTFSIAGFLLGAGILALLEWLRARK